jgi:ABC-type antimicrobial peptide transport system, ATPase component
MLQLKKITKTYLAGDNEVEALKGVDISFRESEFVSILGQSGCGKTTLLNIIGGLDRYTTGDLIINGKSTKEFKDRDWDTYRNHSIGFVFQTYNLIPHQTVLSNVELALTLSGVSKTERRKRAIDVLEKVGLADQINKRPNQMSGGQMQRVAIARALVNDPDILLADEPTGALDSETSVQIMELLKEIAKEKLVIMVTHNPDIADKYSTRIIRLLDGNVIDDTKPFNADNEKTKNKMTENKKTSMSFKTALSLSLNNLMTKKGRTILTAIAGSIGIIGIALILSLSNGIQLYIKSVEEDTLSSYPITIEETSMDMTSFMTAGRDKKEEKREENKIYSNNILGDMVTSMTAQVTKNNLEDFRAYLESNKTNIKDYTNAIQYSYNLNLQLYNSDTSKEIIQVNPSTVMEKIGLETSNSPMTLMMGAQFDVWVEMLDNRELLKKQYDVLEGRWPEKYNEVVVVVNEKNEISDYTLYALGIKDQSEVENLMKKMLAGEKIEFESTSYEYKDLVNLTYKLVLNTDYYAKESGLWVDKKSDTKYMKNVLAKAEEIKIVGIIRPNEEAMISDNSGYIFYTKELTEHVINKVNNSEVAKAQLKDENINIFTGLEFSENKEFDMSSLTPEQQNYLASLSQEELTQVIANYMATYGATYESNLETLGIVNLDKPSAINIYPKDFDSKKEIEKIIKSYNDQMKKEGKEESTITYVDMVGLLMSGITTIIDIISYVLIAFVSISLVVSSIMIGIITYISVLERTKEIGILRAVGASKKDISRVFNAETIIEGFAAGLFGIAFTFVLTIPINIVIKNMTGISNIAVLPLNGAIVLIAISVFLTVVAGLIPSRMASKKDPVEALRTE